MRNVFIIPSVYVRSCIVLGQSIVHLSHMIDDVLFVKQCYHWMFVMVSHILGTRNRGWVFELIVLKFGCLASWRC